MLERDIIQEKDKSLREKGEKGYAIPIFLEKCNVLYFDTTKHYFDINRDKITDIVKKIKTFVLDRQKKLYRNKNKY